MTGCGAAWLARLTGGQEVPGSNPGSPTTEVQVRRRGAALRLTSPNPIPAQTPRQRISGVLPCESPVYTFHRLRFPLNAPMPAESRIVVSGAPPLADCPLAGVMARSCEGFLYLVKDSVRRPWHHRLDPHRIASSIRHPCHWPVAIRHLHLDVAWSRTERRLDASPMLHPLGGRVRHRSTLCRPRPPSLVLEMLGSAVSSPTGPLTPSTGPLASASTAVPSGVQSLCPCRISGLPRGHFWRRSIDPSQ